MSIYNSTKVRPYVYICIDKASGQMYIGYREKNTVPSDIDLPKYKSSSKVVKPNFENYYWQIVAEFELGEDAYDFEQQLIFENWNNPLLLNKHCSYGKRRFKPASVCPDKTRQKISKSNKGKPKSPEHCAKLKAAKQHTSDETRAKQSKVKKGKLSLLKGRPSPLKGKPSGTKGIPKPKLSIVLTGRTMSKESSDKKSKALKNKPWSAAKRAAYEEKYGKNKSAQSVAKR